MTTQELGAVIKKNPISVTCGALVVALLLTLYFRADAKGNAETALNDKSAQGERYAMNIKNAAHLEDHLAEVTAANKEIEARAVRINQLGTNSQFFYKLEGDTGVKLIDFRQTTQAVAKGKGAYTPVAFVVSAQGSFHQILHFLRLLESGTHYSRVNSASINANVVKRNEPLTITLNLDLLGLP